MPNANIVAMDDMLEKVRSVKSAEEIGVLREAAKLGDLMLSTCRDTARPGVKDCEVYANMMRAMVANGGEEPTLFLWGCDKYRTRIRSACRQRGRCKRATLSSARCIRSLAAISPMSSGRSRSASQRQADRDLRRLRRRLPGVASRASGPAKPSRPRWRPLRTRLCHAVFAYLRSRHPRPRARLARIPTLPPPRHCGRPRGLSRLSATASSRAWCSRSTSTYSIRSGRTERPAACSPRRRNHRDRRARMHSFPMDFQKIPV